jgi:PIN domain nuclease of toxin-antitoxin system
MSLRFLRCGMKALIDTGVWFRRFHRLPMRTSLKKFLDAEVDEFHLCPLSIAEITFKWQRGRLPQVPDPNEWLERSIQEYHFVTPSPKACLKAGLWEWDHGDLVDRILASISFETGLVLVHTDMVLKELNGFPQRYFPNTQ